MTNTTALWVLWLFCGDGTSATLGFTCCLVVFLMGEWYTNAMAH